ncbi:MAG: L,D-transpeptidase family protein [Rhodovibrionaceae bacterium]|nr:L,D-transpeptidase family protein [Rhodovibrionaceae bacterium]
MNFILAALRDNLAETVRLRRFLVNTCAAALTAAGLALFASLPVSAGADTPRVQVAAEREIAPVIAALLEDEGTLRDGVGVPLDFYTLQQFYAGRDHQAAWVDALGLTDAGRSVVKVLAEADREGLRAEDYFIADIATLSDSQEPAALGQLDVLISGALLEYAGDLKRGRLAPRSIDPELFQAPDSFDRLTELRRLAASQRPGADLRDLAPALPEYRRLRRALAHYREIEAAGGWPGLPEGETLKEGMRDPQVAVLRRHLTVTGDLSVSSNDAELFDSGLTQAVMRYQRRLGLDADGVVGPATRAQLNVPVNTRIGQIVLNMERWRWMPEDLGERYVLVNLAGFELEVVEFGSVHLAMKVVVGRPYRRTPVFSDTISYLEVNPTWTVPPTILREDILPKLRKDPGYLAENNMKLYHGWDASAPALDPAGIDWQSVPPRANPYRIVQAPGPKNALGRIKFMFPNKYQVYLHDTPSRELFSRPARAFSSGCIRVERPMELADYLLGANADWDRSRVEKLIAEGQTTRVNLARPVPVHLTYATAWIGEGGTIHFREDVYGRDTLLADALFVAGRTRGG